MTKPGTYLLIYSAPPYSRPEDIRVLGKMHLWSPRRNKSNAVKRSMSSPTTALVTSIPSSSTAKPEDTEEEGGEESDKKRLTEISAARDALLGNGSELVSEVVSKAGNKERREEGWATGLFYAYARRVGFSFFLFRGLDECLRLLGRGRVGFFDTWVRLLLWKLIRSLQNFWQSSIPVTFRGQATGNRIVRRFESSVTILVTRKESPDSCQPPVIRLPHTNAYSHPSRQTFQTPPVTSSPSPPPKHVKNGGTSYNLNLAVHHPTLANRHNCSPSVAMICLVERGRIPDLRG